MSNSDFTEDLNSDNSADAKLIIDETNETKAQKCIRIGLSLLVGQILAALLAGSATFAALLVKDGMDLPLIQNLPHYTLMTFTFGFINITRHLALNWFRESTSSSKKEKQSIEVHSRGRKIALYCLAGILDMHAFWAIVAAYKYTNLTSVQLLDCLSIPASMFFSYFILRHSYRWLHYLSAFICVVGACLMVGADLLASGQNAEGEGERIVNSQTDVAIGDVLAILGALLYGASSVVQEYLVIHHGSLNFLTWSPLISAVLSAIYTAVLERNQLTEWIFKKTIDGNPVNQTVIYYLLGYALSMFFLESLSAHTVVRIGAVFINLSLLSSDVYSLIVGIVLFHIPFHFLYFFAFAIIILGVVCFALYKPGSRDLVI